VRVPAVDIAFDDALQGPQRQDLADEVGDFVLRRADDCWSYHLACVVDDAFQGITEVVRGCDLLDSTPRQIFLQQRLGLPTPAYLHLPLALRADISGKLSKSTRDLTLDRSDPLPDLRRALRLLGLEALPGDEVETLLGAAIGRFDPQRIGDRRQAPWPAQG
jgi:glutamyl-Q tRNA(Asp) synthetase